MRGFFILLFVGQACLSQLQAQEFLLSLYPKPQTPQISSGPCPKLSEDFCELIDLKPWSSSEQGAIQNELDFLSSHGLNYILRGALQNGISRIVRATYGFSLDIFLDRPYKRETSHFAVTDKPMGWIVLFDLFFNNPVPRDPVSQVPNQSLTFLHELVHAYDHDSRISQNPFFLSLIGFETQGPTYRFLKIPLQQIEVTIEKILELKGLKKYEEADFLDRSTAMEFGLPRLYSTKSPSEALADLTSHIFYDSDSPLYISPHVIHYIDRHILKGARGFDSH